MKSAIVTTLLTTSLVGALMLGTSAAQDLFGNDGVRAPAATPRSLITGSDLVCIVSLNMPSCIVGDVYTAQAQVLSVVGSVWDSPALSGHIEVVNGVTNIYVVTPYPPSDRSGRTLLRNGQYMLFLSKTNLALEKDRLKRTVRPSSVKEAVSFGVENPLLFDVSTQATFSFVGGARGAVVLYEEPLKNTLGSMLGSSLQSILDSWEQSLLGETFGTNDISIVTNAIWTLSGALCSDSVESAMAQLSSSSNAITADAARKWPASEMRTRFHFQSSP